MNYQPKTLLEIKEFCLIQEKLILQLISRANEKPLNRSAINNDYGVLKSRLHHMLKHYKKKTVKHSATPDEITFYFPMLQDVYSKLQVPIRGKVDTFFIQTLEAALELTRKYLSKIEHTINSTTPKSSNKKEQ